MIGVFGGTFNPIHIGHLIMAQETLVALNLSKVIFVPAKIPPQKNISISPHHRYNMVEIAIANNPTFEISDIELKSQRISYTSETIKLLKKKLKSPFTSL